jgi:hypothetical protein
MEHYFNFQDNNFLIISIIIFIFCLFIQLFIEKQNNKIYESNEEYNDDESNNEESNEEQDDESNEESNEEQEDEEYDEEQDNEETNEEEYEEEDDEDYNPNEEKRHLIKMYSYLTKRQLLKLVGVSGRSKTKGELIDMSIEKFRTSLVRIVINQILTKKYQYLNVEAREYLETNREEIEVELNNLINE